MMTSILHRLCRWIVLSGGGVVREERADMDNVVAKGAKAAAWDDGDPDAVRIIAALGPPPKRWEEMTSDERARATLQKIVW
jgi:hypothetical protein